MCGQLVRFITRLFKAKGNLKITTDIELFLSRTNLFQNFANYYARKISIIRFFYMV